MSKRADLLLACMMGNRWLSTSAPAAGTTAVASSPVAPGANSRPHLETIWASIHNRVGAGAINFTVGIEVRHASIAGTLIASLSQLVPFSSTAQVSLSSMGIAGKRGSRLSVSMNTVIASVTQTVNAAGWMEDTNG